jgi:hypothetical protein
LVESPVQFCRSARICLELPLQKAPRNPRRHHSRRLFPLNPGRRIPESVTTGDRPKFKRVSATFDFEDSASEKVPTDQTSTRVASHLEDCRRY